MKTSTHTSLLAYNTFKINATTAHFLPFDSTSAWFDILQTHPLAAESGLVLGGGSNVLLIQPHYHSVLQNRIQGKTIDLIDSESVHVSFGAGENWDDCVAFCVQHGFHGIENLSGIPGNVGAAPIQNIGAYGVELSDHLVNVNVIDRKQHRVRTLSADACELNYRDSRFKHDWKNHFIITQITLRLSRQPRWVLNYPALQTALTQQTITPSLNNIRQTILSIRSSKLPDPSDLPNAGSFFKNPVVSHAHFSEIQSHHPELPSFPINTDRIKIPAAWLIEQCGFKGHRAGDAGVHTHQALVLVNHHQARGKDILQLANNIQHTVKQQFNIQLEPEVNVI